MKTKQNGGLFKSQIERKQGHTSIFTYHLLPSTECTGLNGRCSVYIMIYDLKEKTEEYVKILQTRTQKRTLLKIKSKTSEEKI